MPVPNAYMLERRENPKYFTDMMKFTSGEATFSCLLVSFQIVSGKFDLVKWDLSLSCMRLVGAYASSVPHTEAAYARSVPHIA
eukprot:3941009-Rhodomonas_salina.5